MFDESPRATKRRKTGAYATAAATSTPTSTRSTRSSRNSGSRPLVTYSSKTKQDRRTPATELHSKKNDSQNDTSVGSDVVDSAYHSMTTTQAEASESEEHTTNKITSERKSRRSTAVQEVSSGKEIIGTVELDRGQHRAPENNPSRKGKISNKDEEHSLQKRTSARIRKKIWKHTEAEDATKARKATAGSSRAPSTPVHTQSSSKDPGAPDALPPDTTPTKMVSHGEALTNSVRKRGRPRKNPLPIPETLNDRIALNTRKASTKQHSSLGSIDNEDGDQNVQLAATPLATRTGKTARTTPSSVHVDKPASLDLSSMSIKLAKQEGASSTTHLLNLLKEAQYETLFMVLKRNILAGLTGRQRLVLVEQEADFQQVNQVVKHTIAAGEGNSMLVIGHRGSGKTNLVETIISNMAKECCGDFHVIRLDGSIHTDDKLATKEIWRQLGREMEIDDGQIGNRSYADALTSLLALLSQPEELLVGEDKEKVEDTRQDVHQDSSGNADKDTDVAQEKEQSRRTSKSIIFVINEFDLFTSHPRQTLLYNLFDIAQSRKAPIVVLGLTTKLFVVESLEKRVKSRFSHRSIYISSAKTYATFLDICKTALLAQPLQKTLPVSLLSENVTPGEKSKFMDLHAAWCAHITSLFSDSAFDAFLRRIYCQSKSVPAFLSAALIPIASMCSRRAPSAIDFLANALLPPDSKLHLLSSLSEMELFLLIAAARLEIILDTDTCNFNMAYDECCSLADRLKTQSSASGVTALSFGTIMRVKEVALEAWERLEELELLIPVTGTGGLGNMDVGGRGKLCKIDVTLEEIGDSGIMMDDKMMRWCRSI